MTIEKAIEIKQVFLEEHSDIMSCDEIAADKLSIEALIYLIAYRRESIVTNHPLLIGETEE